MPLKDAAVELELAVARYDTQRPGLGAEVLDDEQSVKPLGEIQAVRAVRAIRRVDPSYWREIVIQDVDKGDLKPCR